jgi:hypothetical protein
LQGTGISSGFYALAGSGVFNGKIKRSQPAAAHFERDPMELPKAAIFWRYEPI